MLNLHTVRTGEQRYYLSTVEFGREPGTVLVEPDGTWQGSLTQRLSLAGPLVEPGALDSLLAGRDGTGADLLEGGRRRSNLAYDCTFSPPKSISLVHGIGPAPLSGAMLAAHEAAVGAVLGYLEREAAAVRRTRDGARAGEPAAGLVAAGFVHRSSRAGDPHLHTHLLVANLAPDGEGRWSALDSRRLFLHGGVASALYAAQLRHEVEARTGLGIDPRSATGDLLGFDRQTIGAFSRRSQAIAGELARTGRTDFAARALAAAVTRPAKDLSVSFDELREQWRARARSLGWSTRRLEDLLGRAQESAVRHREPAPPVDPALPLGVVTRRDLLVQLARSAAHGATVDALERAVDSLVERALVREHGEGEPALRARGGRVALPAGVREQRYASTATLEVLRRWDDALRGAHVRDRADRPLAIVETGTTVTELAGTLAGLAQGIPGGGDGVALVAGRWRAACVEALSGMPAFAASPGTLPRRLSSIAVEAAAVHPEPRLAAELLARADQGAAITVLVASPGGGGPPAAATRPARGAVARTLAGGAGAAASDGRREAAGLRRALDAAAVCVVEGDGPRQLIEALCADALATARNGFAPVVVVPDRALAAVLQEHLSVEGSATGIACQVRTPDAVRAASHQPLLVLGPARSLGRAALASPSRIHYVVTPASLLAVPELRRAAAAPALRSRAAWLLEMAEPGPVVDAIGRVPASSLEERSRWRERAAEHERSVRHGLRPAGPDARGRDREPELQRGMAIGR